MSKRARENMQAQERKTDIAKSEVRIANDILKEYGQKERDVARFKQENKINNRYVQSWRMRLRYYKGSLDNELKKFQELYEEMRFENMADFEVKTKDDQDEVINELESRKELAQKARAILPDTSYKDIEQAQMEQNIDKYIQQIDRRIQEVEDYEPVELTDEDRKALGAYDEVMRDNLFNRKVEIKTDAAKSVYIDRLNEAMTKIDKAKESLALSTNIENEDEISDSLTELKNKVEKELADLEDYQEFEKNDADKQLETLLNDINE